MSVLYLLNFYKLGIAGSGFEKIKKELKKHLTNKGSCGILVLSKDENETKEGIVVGVAEIVASIICVIILPICFVGLDRLINHG